MNTTKARLTFRPGKDNSMVTRRLAKIGEDVGEYVVLANFYLGIKEGVYYDCELREMGNKRGFVVLKATESNDYLVMHAVLDCIGVYLGRSDDSFGNIGSLPLANKPLYVYDRTGKITALHYDQIADELQADFNARKFIMPTDKFHLFVNEFILACKKHRGEEDELTVKINDETEYVEVYLKMAYDDTNRGAKPSWIYDRTSEVGYEVIAKQIEQAYNEGKFIMPVDGFDAFMADYLFICKKHYKEHAKKIINEQKKIAFKKSSKGSGHLNQVV